jgi:hypothetical protein
VIENGVKFNGNCTMGVASVAPAAAPKPIATNTVDLNAK